MFIALTAAWSVSVAQPVIMSPSRIPQQVHSKAKQSRCTTPQARVRDELLFLSADAGSGVSTASVAGLDQETTTGEIQIAPGRRPLYLVVSSSHPMIFRLSGATGRIHRVLILNPRGSGVTGVSRSKVSIRTISDCQLSRRFTKFQTEEAENFIHRIIGRKSDQVGATYQLHTVRIGAGPFQFKEADRKRAYDAATELQIDALLFHPGGVVRIPQRLIVSIRRPRNYRILPSTSGAAQLERSGVLEKLPEVDVNALLDKMNARYGVTRGRRFTFWRGYLVKHPTRIPIGLCGSHQLTFIVRYKEHLKGDPCHSVILATDGTVLFSPSPV